MLFWRLASSHVVTISCVEAEGVDVRKRYTGYRTNTEWETDAAAVLVSSNQALPRSFSSQESMLQSPATPVFIRRNCATF
jgi:hypothetical protein